MSDGEDAVIGNRRSTTLVEDDQHSDTSEELTETAVGTPFGVDTRAKEVRTAVATTHRRVWQDFYQWEPEYCSQVITSLASSSSGVASQDFYLDDEGDAMDVDSEDDGLISYETSFTVCSWDNDNQFSKHVMPVRGADAADLGDSIFQELPYYEACTPASFYIYEDKDALRLPCQFIKYAADPNFDSRAFLKLYHSVAWQDPLVGKDQDQWRDPDQRIIAATAIRELLQPSKGITAGTALSLHCDDIDDTEIFPVQTYTILDGMKFNDADGLEWLGLYLGSPQFPKFKLSWRNPARDESKSNFSHILTEFCAELSCVHFKCFLHQYPTGRTDEYPVETYISSEAIKEQFLAKGKKPCGPECFSTRDTGHVNIEHENLELLDKALAISPDKPCDISAVVGIPCFIVFARRTETIRESKPPKREVPVQWDGLDSGGLHLNPLDYILDKGSTIDLPCRHRGPCSSRTKCPCFKKGYHCRRNCMCSDKCALRFKGCSRHQKCDCSQDSRRPWKDTCACASHGWECGPDCHKPRDKRMNLQGSCRNMATQFKLPTEIEIKGSRWGFGAFALKAVRKDQYIGEYVGEILSNAEGDQIAMQFKHTKYNYTFNLNPDYFADALPWSNVTRYFNHTSEKKKKKPNVEAQSKIVNGDHRIIFTALRDIKRGEEMMFDYGEDYWKDMAA